MESSSSYHIELKVISCHDLKAFNFFQRLSVYVLVSIDSDDNHNNLHPKQQQKTPTDREGDGNPEWNHTIHFEVSKTLFQDCDDKVFIHFDLRHEGAMFGDKSIGEVRVPLMDLIQESNGVVRFLSYDVRNADRKSNGVLSFSFKVKDLGLKGDFPASQIDDYPVFQHHQCPETQISLSEEVDDGESLKIHYPVLDQLEKLSLEPQHYPSLSTNHESLQEIYVLPQDTYYQLRPPPPPPVPPPYPPPPAIIANGPYYQPWLRDSSPSAAIVHAHGYNSYGSHLSYVAGRPLKTWPNGWRAAGSYHSSSWNGRGKCESTSQKGNYL